MFKDILTLLFASETQLKHYVIESQAVCVQLYMLSYLFICSPRKALLRTPLLCSIQIIHGGDGTLLFFLC